MHGPERAESLPGKRGEKTIHTHQVLRPRQALYTNKLMEDFENPPAGQVFKLNPVKYLQCSSPEQLLNFDGSREINSSPTAVPGTRRGDSDRQIWRA